MNSYKDRLAHSYPVFKDMLKRATPMVRQTAIDGGSAGAHTVSDIKAGDQLVGVMRVDNTTPGMSDITSEFDVDESNIVPNDGELDNTGGTDTSGDQLLVTWMAWAE